MRRSRYVAAMDENVIVAAAAAEYINLPPALQNGGQNALLHAAVRLAGELTAGHSIADRVREAIAARAGS